MLKLEHFEYMRTVARLGSIRKAAEALYVSQPYLSHCLRELEEELGVRLMERSFQGILLTAPGELREYLLLIESIKSGVGAEGLVENNLFPHLFAENEKMPIRFDNNRSLMYYLTKSDRCFTVGQKCLNRSNPFLISRELLYIPIKEESAYTTTGVLFRREARLSEEAQAWIGFL